MAIGTFVDNVYSYTLSGDTESQGGACDCVVKWTSYWKSGNTHSMTITVQGLRTDGYSTTLFGTIKVGENSRENLGSQNYPGDPAYQETFDSVTYDVETDDYGNLLTLIKVSVGFNRSSSEQHYAEITSAGVVLDKPQKIVHITCPDGILCTVDKSPLYIDDEFVINVTVTGIQWSESPLISVTGAIKIEDLKYTVTGDVYIVITGVLSVHKVYITKTAGIDVIVTDDINGYSLSDGSSVEHYTQITISCVAKPGYKTGQLVVNGEKYSGSVSISVMSDVVIIATSDALGLSHIYTGSSFEKFHVFIYNGSDWGMYIPLVYDGSSWNICA